MLPAVQMTPPVAEEMPPVQIGEIDPQSVTSSVTYALLFDITSGKCCVKETEDAAGFAAGSANYTFGPGEGLPGRAMQTGEYAWSYNVQQLSAEKFPRLHLAKEFGIKGMFCIKVPGGVVEFGSTRELTESEWRAYFANCDAGLVELPALIAASLSKQRLRSISTLFNRTQRTRERYNALQRQSSNPDVSWNERSQIGRGRYARVFVGEYEGAQVAIKKSCNPRVSHDGSKFVAEACLMQVLEHRNVVRFLAYGCRKEDEGGEVALDPDQTDSKGDGLHPIVDSCTLLEPSVVHRPAPSQTSSSSSSDWERTSWPFMILELVDGANLKKHEVTGELANMKLGEALDLADQLCSAMVYLHTHPTGTVIHRDLKLTNVLLERASRRVVLLDFGQAITVADMTTSSRHECELRAGVYDYMTPEVYCMRPYTSSVDVYAFGVLLRKILEQALGIGVLTKLKRFGLSIPWAVWPCGSTFEKAFRLPADPRWPKDLRHLVNSCCSKDPSARPTFEQIQEVLVRIRESLAESKGQNAAAQSQI